MSKIKQLLSISEGNVSDSDIQKIKNEFKREIKETTNMFNRLSYYDEVGLLPVLLTVHDELEDNNDHISAKNLANYIVNNFDIDM